ncbi:gamma-glutamyltransferase [Microcoleus sp. FACHB-1515]|uniref:gamma-glutamyltransferase n=1 Tax=Cyanophyceae TaxID=3028117 RepID=UPI001687F2C0|nr:gamma-glutamyltransferase [Microcoleus sp. FACHB-1515]MBD2089139.1 gamma-glutamyltransferase [Microcoleus sp. FACHB-1515]
MGTKGAIAAGHPKTVEAGVEMFRLGGNVFDAVVAAVLASCVVEPTLTSLGGGGFMLAHTSDNQNILFDFFTQTPKHKKDPKELEFYPAYVNFGSVTQEFFIGLGSVGVPGTFGGLYYVHQRLGRLPFQVVCEPAIDYARQSIELAPFQAHCLKILEPILMATAESRQIYAPNGTLLKAGEAIAMPDMADALTLLSQEGARAFYEGEIAQKIVKDCAENGGYLTLEDLKNYQVIERQPLIASYRGNTLLTNPPPSSGGALIAFALGLLEQINLSKFQFGTPAHLYTLTQVIELTNLARREGYDANLYQPDVVEKFLSNDLLNHYAVQLRPSLVNKLGSTTHLSAIDSEGNAASVTSSNGEGCSYVVPGTGIMLNNMLGEADLHPQGFHQWQTDVRVSSAMAPTMLLRDMQPEIVLGSSGSSRIRSAVLQVISNIIDFKMPVDAAVNSPRIHWENGELNLEPDLTRLNFDLPFAGELVRWNQLDMFFGGVHAVYESESGELSGAGDRRRSGAVGVYE